MRPVLSSLSLILFFGFAGDAAAACLGVAPMTKEIRIKNNSTDTTIFPVMAAPKYDKNNPSSADLWMQAECGIQPIEARIRRFTTTKVYRAYINLPNGIPPGAEVRITVPFYTKLKEVPIADLGKVDDQFINWWNSSRIYFFYGKPALDSALLDGFPVNTNFGNNITNQIKPTCFMVNTACSVTFKSHTIDPRANIPFQLQEYTFASAEGPVPGGVKPPGSPFKIEKEWVNYNVSSLDSVYLPVAMGPIIVQGQDPRGKTNYLGDGATVADFNAKLKAFSNNGAGWPFFIPVYFADPLKESIAVWPPLETNGPPCSFISPFTDANPILPPYLFPKLPGTANLLIESFRKVQQPDNTFGTIVPPLLSSQPSNFRAVKNYDTFKCGAVKVPTFTSPALGTSGQAVIDLWNKCTTTTQDMTETCKDIRVVKNFFLTNYRQKCTAGPDPDLAATIFAVYGWVPISFPLFPISGQTPCAGPALITTAPSPTAYKVAIEKYCVLQYNYLTPNLPLGLVFNPYTKLIHETLGSTAYAFSIDDAQAFRHLVAPGVIITVGGISGLDDTKPSEKPNPSNFRTFCRAA